MPSVSPPPASSPRPPSGVPSAGVTRTSHAAQQGKVRRDQLIAGAVGVGCLVVSMLLQGTMGSTRKDWNLVRDPPETEKSLQSLAVTFPRLTLGGFRSIVSTALWMQAEEDKNERNWIDLETKYDIIGGLQPYFVTVYIYHAWNQAYNLSAQWQDYDTKYKWVLDGLAYLYKGEDYNPGNPDLFLETGHLYMLKLGGAFERDFYREHWRSDQARLYELNDKRLADRDESIALKHVREAVHHHDARYSMDDPRGDYLHIEELPDPRGVKDNPGWGIQITDPGTTPAGFNLFSGRTDGKKATDPMPFRYGVSPFYFAYREYQRAMGNTRPSNMGAPVLDAWPAMNLRLWCRDDLYYISDTMKRMFGKNPDPAFASTTPKFADKATEMADCYRNIQMIAPRAVDLFQLHLGKFPQNVNVHTKHILETQSFLPISKAEFKLFDTLVQWELNGRKFTSDPKGAAIKAGFIEADQLYKDALPPVMKWVDNMYPLIEGQPLNPDRGDAEQYATALRERSQGIEALLTLAPNEAPDMSFLNDPVVEK